MGRGRGGREWNAPAPSKAPAWAQETYTRGGAAPTGGRSSLHSSSDDNLFRNRENFSFGAEDDSLGALSQQTLLMAAAARQSLTSSSPQLPVRPAAEENDHVTWVYKDPLGNVQGPFSNEEMNGWYTDGYFNDSLMIKRQNDPKFIPLGQLSQQYGGRSPFRAHPEPEISVIPPHLTSQEPVGHVINQRSGSRQNLTQSFEAPFAHAVHSDLPDSRVILSDHALMRDH